MNIRKNQISIPQHGWWIGQLRENLETQKINQKADDVWKNQPWKKFRRQVFRLRAAIFKAQKNGNRAKVKRDALVTIA